MSILLKSITIVISIVYCMSNVLTFELRVGHRELNKWKIDLNSPSESNSMKRFKVLKSGEMNAEEVHEEIETDEEEPEKIVDVEVTNEDSDEDYDYNEDVSNSDLLQLLISDYDEEDTLENVNGNLGEKDLVELLETFGIKVNEESGRTSPWGRIRRRLIRLPKRYLRYFLRHYL